MTEWNPRINESAQCRREFEVWAADHGYNVHRMLSMNAYFEGATDRAWVEWQLQWKPGQAKQ